VTAAGATYSGKALQIMVARFFLGRNTKTAQNVPNEHKMYKMNTKCTKLTQNVPNQRKMHQNRTKCTKSTQNAPNDHKIFRTAIKISTFSYLRPSKIYPNRDFWFEDKPSGNPHPDPD
jgi:hypothetical protein